MKYAVLNRLRDNDHTQTLGHFILYDTVNVELDVKALELPDKNNKKRISRIPAGVYKCTKRYSKTYKWHYHVQDVEGRTWILIHVGNYVDDTLGCILLGSDFIDIDNNGHLDVSNSRNTMAALLEKAGDCFMLIINDIDTMAA